MPALVFEPEDSIDDPDSLKVPERPDHRQAIDVIAMAAIRLLGPGFQVFRDMNWYPGDGGGPIAPDIMVLPAGTVLAPSDDPGAKPKSYRQDKTGGPVPTVVVEVASRSDSWETMLNKLARYRDLGTVVYTVAIEPGIVQRSVAGAADMAGWTDVPIEELGGLRIGFASEPLVVTMPDGVHATSENALLDHFIDRAQSAERRAADAERRARTLADRLRRMGVDPDEPDI